MRMSISRQLSQIALVAERGSPHESLRVQGGRGPFTCTIQKSFLHYLPHWMLFLFSRWIPEEFKEGNRATLRYFHQVFGDRVIRKVCAYQRCLRSGIALNCDEVLRLFKLYEKDKPAQCAALFKALSAREQVTHIGNALQKRWNWERVVIDGKRGPRFCKAAGSIHRLIPHWIASRLPGWFGHTYHEENRKTIKHFYALFGYRRMDRISKRFNLNLRERMSAGKALTRGDIEKIFAGIAEVRIEDVEELVQIVQGREKGDLGTVEELAHEMLQEAFRGKVVTDLTKGDMDALYRYLVPFDKMETIFLNNTPRFTFRPQLSSGLKKLHQRLFLCETMRRDASLPERIWDVWVAKGFLKRKKQDIGVIIPHPKGYYKVFGELEGEGASFLFLKALQRELPSIVKAQGTRTSATWDAFKSILDDFSDEVGTRGVDATEQSLLYFLGKREDRPPEFDHQYRGITHELFYRDAEEWYKGIAFSLGCANLQHMADRHPHLFRLLSLTCPPGISAQRCREWSERPMEEGPSIRYMVEVDDLVHRGGEANLGVGCDSKHTPIELVAYAPKEMTRDEVTALLLHPPALPEMAVFAALAIVKAFTGAHVRQTTLRQEYSSEVYSNQTPEGRMVVDTVLGDHTVETVRKRAAASGRVGAQRAQRGYNAARLRAQALGKGARARARALQRVGARILWSRG